jgi:hypothetical protein
MDVSPLLVGSTPSLGDTSIFLNPFLNLYSWAIQLYNPSQSGHLTFGAFGFTLRVAKAVLSKPLRLP